MSAKNTTPSQDRAIESLQRSISEAAGDADVVVDAINEMDKIIHERDEEIEKLKEEIRSLEKEIYELQNAP